MNFVQPIRDLDKIEELEKLLKSKNYRNYLLFATGIYTGIRISDILPLRVRDVKNYQYLSIVEKKTRKTKKIRIQPSLELAFRKFIKDKSDDEFLFKSRKGNRPISREQAYRILKTAAQTCGLFEIGTHTLRKTFGYHSYKKDKNLGLVMQMLNHSKEEHTLRYIGITQDDEDRARLGLKFN